MIQNMHLMLSVYYNAVTMTDFGEGCDELATLASEGESDKGLDDLTSDEHDDPTDLAGQDEEVALQPEMLFNWGTGRWQSKAQFCTGVSGDSYREISSHTSHTTCTYAAAQIRMPPPTQRGNADQWSKFVRTFPGRIRTPPIMAFNEAMLLSRSMFIRIRVK